MDNIPYLPRRFPLFARQFQHLNFKKMKVKVWGHFLWCGNG